MGVYIKGMAMPQSCICCRLECLFRMHDSHNRSSYCPLVEVKEPTDTADTPQTESTGSPIGDYRDGVGAWQTDCGWGEPHE